MEYADKISFDDHDLSVPVYFTVLTEMETKLGKQGIPAIKLGMKCHNDSGQEYQEWVNYVLWGTDKGKFQVDDFISKINKDVSVQWDNDVWSGYDHDQKPFKFAKGMLTLCKNQVGDRVYYNVDQIYPMKKQEESDAELAPDLSPTDLF